MLKLHSIVKTYDQNMILDHIDINIENGDWVMIVGESGSGKTTLLKIMTGLTDYQGKIYYQNHLLSYQDQQIVRRNDFAIVFQEKNFIEEYTIYQNLLVTTTMSHSSSKEIDQLLNQFHLQECKHKKINQLSGGQLQKLAIIKALLKKPRILFLDEPTGNLDKQSTQELIQILKDINKSITLVMITHDLELTQYAKHVYEIKNKHLSKSDNSSCQQNDHSLIKSKNRLPLRFLSRLGFWNFQYYYKTYLLGIILLTLASTCYVFSSQLGLYINNDTSILLSQKDSQYELLINSENIVQKEKVKELAKQTHAKKYNLMLNLFQDSTIDKIIDNQKTLNIANISIKDTYDLNETYQTIVITSKLYQQFHEDHIDHIEIPLNVLSSFEKINRIYWTSKDDYLYRPQYVSYHLQITDYEIIESDDLCIYLDSQTIEKIADQCQKPKSYSNQDITQFSFQYNNYDDLKKAKNMLENQENYTVTSIYNDLQNIQNEVTQQFSIFHYTSLLIIVIVFLIIFFITMTLYKNQRRQKQIFNEYALLPKEKGLITLFETLYFLSITIIISTLLSLLFMYIFNHTFEISAFMPQSLVSFYQNNQISIHLLKWFEISYLNILFHISLLIIFPIIIFYIFIFLYHKKTQKM